MNKNDVGTSESGQRYLDQTPPKGGQILINLYNSSQNYVSLVMTMIVHGGSTLGIQGIQLMISCWLSLFVCGFDSIWSMISIYGCS